MRYIISGKENPFRCNFENAINVTNLVDRGFQDTNTKLSSGKLFISAKMPQSFVLKADILDYDIINDPKSPNWLELKLSSYFCLRRDSIMSRYIYLSYVKKHPNFNGEIKVNGKEDKIVENETKCIDLLDFEFVKVYLEFDDSRVNCIEYDDLDVEKKAFCIAMERFGECTFCAIDFENVVTPSAPFYIKFLNEKNKLISIDKFWLYNILDSAEIALNN